MAPRRQVAPNQTECVECGLGATSITITLGGDAQSHPPADPRAMAQLAAHRERAQAVLSDPPFPLFGLDDRWMGPRSLGGTGSSGGETTSVTLAHGHLLEQVGPDIRVETKRDARFPVQALRALEVRALVMRLAHHTGEMREDVRTATFAEDATDVLAPWEQMELPVDERPVPFHVLSGGEQWAAVTTLGESVVAITARSWPLALTGLETVHDLAPYREA